MDPLCGSTWSEPGTVAGFADASPNETLLAFAERERRHGGARAVDVGCGAGRNLVPLARQGWTIVGVDLSRPMTDAAAARLEAEQLSDHARVALAAMDALPIAGRSVDLIVAHGIWNLARSDAELRRAITEAARIAVRGAGLFVFTFSRTTLPAAASPIPESRSCSPVSPAGRSAS
jgi:cyclopropane fatty-acyl-phospholipid synthase-like methyltransferase